MSSRKIRIIRVKTNPQPRPQPKQSGPEGDVYFYIGKNISKETQDGKVIAENIKCINSSKKSAPMPLVNAGIKPGMVLFLQCLDIYENNQSYYSDDINELIKLEQWFSSIPEPYSNENEWIERENNRKKYGISDYCDEEIRKRLLSKRECPH